jgi:hypothetical protein
MYRYQPRYKMAGLHAISSDGAGNGLLAISNSSGTPVAVITSHGAGNGLLSIRNAAGTPIAMFGSMSDGSGIMFLADQNGDFFEAFHK